MKTAGFIGMNGVFVAVGFTVASMTITWVISKMAAAKGSSK